MRNIKIVIEKHSDGFVAYPLGVKGVVVGEGDTYEEALADVRSALKFHAETFGSEALEGQAPVLEAFLTEAAVEIKWLGFRLMPQSEGRKSTQCIGIPGRPRKRTHFDGSK